MQPLGAYCVERSGDEILKSENFILEASVSRNAKILIVILAGMLLLCACGSITIAILGGWLISRTATTETASIGDIGSEIADFQLPAGFVPDYAVNIAGIKMVAYRPQIGNGHIMLAQVPEGMSVDAAKLEEEIRSAARSRGYTWFNEDMHVVGEEHLTIRGQETTLITSEGMSRSRGALRQVTASFHGKAGQAWVMVIRPVSEWDRAQVDAFLASIR